MTTINKAAKTIVALLICTALILSLVSQNAMAAPKKNDNAKHQGQYSASYDKHINGAKYHVEIKYNKADFNKAMSISGKRASALKVEQLVAEVNAKIEKMVAHAQATPQDDVAKLIKDVDKLIAKLHKIAAKAGVKLQCEYTEYFIDGQYVLIDPIRIVRR
ncbi:MAG: hypothetical protein Q4B96_07115 [Bacillota bacterium]|nr:hypothetical protein [Bacillota bacterium]